MAGAGEAGAVVVLRRAVVVRHGVAVRAAACQAEQRAVVQFQQLS